MQYSLCFVVLKNQNGKNHLAFNQIIRPLVYKLKLFKWTSCYHSTQSNSASKKCKQLTSDISSSGWINLLVALVVVSVAGLLVIEAAGLAAVLFVVLVVEAVDCVYAGNVGFGGSVVVAGVLFKGLKSVPTGPWTAA